MFLLTLLWEIDICLSYMHDSGARLRNNCSGLNSDLFRNHFNNPSCELSDEAEMHTTTSFNAENILLKDMFSMIQLEAFIL